MTRASGLGGRDEQMAAASRNKRSTDVGSRMLPRMIVAILVAAVAAAGAWGAGSAFNAARAAERSKQLEAGYQSVRYALALERSSVRDSNSEEARRQFTAA